MTRHRRSAALLPALVLTTALAPSPGCTINGRPLFSLGGKTGAGGGGTGASLLGSSAPGAWCESLRRSGEYDLAKALDPKTPPSEALPYIAQALCHPENGEEARRGELEAARQRRMRELLMSEADWRDDGVEWAGLQKPDRSMFMQVHATPQVRLGALGPMDQWAVIDGADDDVRASYLADALALTAWGRLSYVARCIASEEPALWAACQGDIDALRPEKLAAELATESERKMRHRMRLRMEYAAVAAALPLHAQRVKQAIAAKPAVARAFELAKAARADWEARLAARRELLAELAAIDDARSSAAPSEPPRCADRAWSRVQEQLAALPRPRLLAAVRDPEQDLGAAARVAALLVGEPDGDLAARLFVGCADERDPIIHALAAAVRAGAGFRGPRTAALTRITQAGAVPLPKGIAGVGDKLYVARPWRGVIPAVGSDGAIQFPTEVRAYRDECVEERTTNRISRVDANGNVYYARECLRRGTVRRQVTPDPIRVAKRYAAGIAAKRYAAVADGVPLVVRPSPTAPPIAVLGAALR